MEHDHPTLTAVHLYPTTMDTYGDRGNVTALTKRAQWRGVEIAWRDVELGQSAPAGCDLLFLGGGQDRVQRAVAEDLVTRHDWLAELAGGGTAMLAVCAGLQLLGTRYVDASGGVLPGVGLLDLETVAGNDRLIGNVVAEVVTGTGRHLLAGFENHGGKTYLGDTEPLGRVLAGHGNNGEDGTEGARSGTLLATYLHGPVLPRNAWLADHLLSLALTHAGLDPALLPALDDGLEAAAREEAIAVAERDRRRDRRRGRPRRLLERLRGRATL
jgi:hypothetical protein